MYYRAVIAPLLACLAMAAASPASADADGDWNRWWVGGFAANPINTFRSLHMASGAVIASHYLTGSMAGVTLGRGFQFGYFYFGANVALSGGVLEGQTGDAVCPGNCYTSLNGLAEGTFSAGLAVGRALFRIGLGPSFGVMRAGQTLYGLNTIYVSGFHTKAGVEFALNGNWSVYVEAQHQRVGDLHYNAPSGHVGVEPQDHQSARIGVNFRL